MQFFTKESITDLFRKYSIHEEKRKDLDKIYAGWIRDAERQLDPRKNEQETMDTSTLI